MILPSKELLSTVLQKEILCDDTYSIQLDFIANEIQYFTPQTWATNPVRESISCKILAMLIIEWIPNDYKLQCYKTDAGWCSMVGKETEEDKITFMEGYFQTATEAIFQAGEWILKNITRQ